MPLFNKETLFIHIPKSGGSSIQKFLVDKGQSCELYSPDLNYLINHHTPQHCTYKELEHYGIISKAKRIFSIIRHPVERVVSEFFYNIEYRGESSILFEKNFDRFLDIFLNKDNNKLFDYHALSNFEFLCNAESKIDPRIQIFKYFETERIEDYLGHSGLASYQIFKTDKADFKLTQTQEKRILDFYKDDMIHFFSDKAH